MTDKDVEELGMTSAIEKRVFFQKLLDELKCFLDEHQRGESNKKKNDRSWANEGP